MYSYLATLDLVCSPFDLISSFRGSLFCLSRQKIQIKKVFPVKGLVRVNIPSFQQFGVAHLLGKDFPRILHR